MNLQILEVPLLLPASARSFVKVGDRIKKGQKLLTLEAMKMETTITAGLDGKIRDVLVQPGRRVETGDLLVVIESE